jgi:hypothetical protein
MLAGGLAFAQSSDVPSDSDASAPQDESTAAQERQAVLARVEGTVYVHIHEHPEGEFVEAELNAPLAAGDLVRTGSDGSAEIALDGESVVDLAPNSDFLVTSLDPAQTEFHLGFGSLVAKLKSLTSGEGMTFRTSNAVAAVRGTELGVAHDGDDQPSRFGVFDEGRVAVQSEGSEGSVMLNPGEETQAQKGARPPQAHALRSFVPARERLAAARVRLDTYRKAWVRRSPQQLRNQRRRLQRLKRIQSGRLRNVSPQLRARRYAHLEKRRQALRKQFQRRLQQRREEEKRRRSGEIRQRQQAVQQERRQERRAQVQQRRAQVEQRKERREEERREIRAQRREKQNQPKAQKAKKRRQKAEEREQK